MSYQVLISAPETDKLQPVGQMHPATCFCVACELWFRQFLQMVEKKSKEEQYFINWQLFDSQFQYPQIKFYWNPALLTHLRSVVWQLSTTVAELQQRLIEWPTKSKIFIIWPFTEKVCQSLSYTSNNKHVTTLINIFFWLSKQNRLKICRLSDCLTIRPSDW